jgi:hypothetical protein
MKKINFFIFLLLSLGSVALSISLINPKVSADCAVNSCGNGEPSLSQISQNNIATQSKSHDVREILIGVLIGIAITLLVLVSVNFLTRIRKKKFTP